LPRAISRPVDISPGPIRVVLLRGERTQRSPAPETGGKVPDERTAGSPPAPQMGTGAHIRLRQGPPAQSPTSATRDFRTPPSVGTNERGRAPW
jgi:hypothetical protein